VRFIETKLYVAARGDKVTL